MGGCVGSPALGALGDELTRHHLPVATKRSRLPIVHRDKHGARVADTERHTLLRIEPHRLTLREHAARVGLPVHGRAQP